MKPNYLQISLLGLTTFVMASCSAPKMAQQTKVLDDVYTTTAKAVVYTPSEKPVVTDKAYNDEEYYGTSDPYYDMDYYSRINRFRYSSPWRSYYDNFYSYSYMPWYTPSVSLGYYYYNPYSLYNAYGYYDPFGYNGYYRYNPFYNYGSPYYWGGGYYGGGYYGGGYSIGGGGIYIGGRSTHVDANYGPRPARGRDNAGYVPNTVNGLSPRPIVGGDPAGRPRTGVVTNDAGRPGRGSSNTYTPNGRTSEAPPSRPTTYDRPTTTTNPRPSYTPPPSTSGGRTESTSSGSGGGGGGRPGRGGR